MSAVKKSTRRFVNAKASSTVQRSPPSRMPTESASQMRGRLRPISHGDSFPPGFDTSGLGPVASDAILDHMEAQSAHPPYSPLLTQCLAALRKHETELHQRGVLHAWIFGSVARGDYDQESDVDVIVQVDYKVFPDLAGLFDLEEQFSQEFGRSVDVVSLGGLKSPKHDHIRREMVFAF